MNKTNIIVALASAVITFLVLGILGATLLDDEPTVNTQDTVQTQEETPNENYKHNFVKACSSQGVTEALCSCMFDKIREDYSLTEMASFGINNELPANFDERYLTPCQNELNAQQI